MFLANPWPAGGEAPDALLGEATYSRKEKSLSILCHRFLQLFSGAPDDCVLLDAAASQLGVGRRRIYDIVNVLEAVRIVDRISKNRFLWLGAGHVESALREIQDSTDEQDLDGLSNDRAASGARRDLSNGSIPDSNAGEGALNDATRKDKSLGVLTRRFLRKLAGAPVMHGHPILSLEDAARQLVDPVVDSGSAPTGAPVAEPSPAEDAAVLKTKLRRLYDIANVLSSVYIVDKLQVDSRKPACRFVGINAKLEQLLSRPPVTGHPAHMGMGAAATPPPGCVMHKPLAEALAGTKRPREIECTLAASLARATGIPANNPNLPFPAFTQAIPMRPGDGAAPVGQVAGAMPDPLAMGIPTPMGAGIPPVADAVLSAVGVSSPDAVSSDSLQALALLGGNPWAAPADLTGGAASQAPASGAGHVGPGVVDSDVLAATYGALSYLSVLYPHLNLTKAYEYLATYGPGASSRGLSQGLSQGSMPAVPAGGLSAEGAVKPGSACVGGPAADTRSPIAGLGAVAPPGMGGLMAASAPWAPQLGAYGAHRPVKTGATTATSAPNAPFQPLALPGVVPGATVGMPEASRGCCAGKLPNDFVTEQEPHDVPPASAPEYGLDFGQSPPPGPWQSALYGEGPSSGVGNLPSAPGALASVRKAAARAKALLPLACDMYSAAAHDS